MPHYRDQLDPDSFDTVEEFDAAQRRAITRPTGVCLRCGRPMTWAQQRQQFGRLLRRGFSIEHAKQLNPRCQTCMTITLKAQQNA